jgi:mannose-1-phosphate guanylyltransferase
MVSCVILCGGSSFRLNPEILLPKPLIDIGGITLLDYQIKWLRRFQIEDIILATNRFVSTSLPVRYSIEEDQLGTGGALKRALDLIKDEIIFVMNVDDLLHYDLRELINNARTSNRNYMVLSRARLPFGLAKLEQSRIVGFEEKPVLKDIYVSTGHYCFHKDILVQYLPVIGNLEDSLNKIAEDRFLYPFIVDDWLTLTKIILESKKYFQTGAGKPGITAGNPEEVRDRGELTGNPAAQRTDQDRSSDERMGPDHRGERNRERVGGTGNSSIEPEGGQTFCGGQLCGHPRRADRE